MTREKAALESGDVDGAVELNDATWAIGNRRCEAAVPAGVCERVRVMQAAAAV